jgi:uncharacterized protein YecT (DUF1311 family)
MKLLPALCFALALSAPFLRAGDSILPKGWNPSTIDAKDYLDRALQDEKSQQGMNRLTGHIASVLDAQLVVAYVKLYERLDEKGRAALKEEQTQWLAKRQKTALAAARSEEGGSASPMEANTAFADFTTKRLQALEARLKKLTADPARR